MAAFIPEHSKAFISHHLQLKMQGIYDSLKSAEKKAADLVLASPEFVSRATIGEAADKAACSQATFVRLAHRLGFQGFPEMKASLAGGNEQPPPQIYEAIAVGDDSASVVKKVFQACIRALSDTLDVFDSSSFSRAAEAVGQAGKIMFCGVGDSSAVAQAAWQKFMRTGMPVFFAEDPNSQLVMAAHMGPGDVLVAVSHMGRSRNVVDLVKYARTRGITVLSITNFPVSPLAKNSDILLLTAAFADHISGEVMSKRIAELCIIECLYVNTLLRNAKLLNPGVEEANRALELNIL